MFGGLHRDGDVGYFVVDLLLCTGKWLVGIHHVAVLLFRRKVGAAILPDESAQTLSHIQQPKLSP